MVFRHCIPYLHWILDLSFFGFSFLFGLDFFAATGASTTSPSVVVEGWTNLQLSVLQSAPYRQRRLDFPEPPPRLGFSSMICGVDCMIWMGAYTCHSVIIRSNSTMRTRLSYEQCGEGDDEQQQMCPLINIVVVSSH